MNRLRSLFLVALCVPLSTAFAQQAEKTDREGVLRLVPSTSLRKGVRLPEPARLVPGILERTAAFRAEHERSELEVDEQLTASAQAFAEWMAKHDLYGHEADGREPADRAKAAGYDYCLVLENIAYYFDPAGLTPTKGAKQFVQGWIDSPGHRRSMLDPDVTEFGVGVALSDRTNTFYAVQLFGRPKSATIGFRLVNRTAETIPYHVGAHPFSVKPGFTMTHTACRPAELRLDDAEKGLVIADGERYAIESPAGTPRLVHLEREPADE